VSSTSAAAAASSSKQAARRPTRAAAAAAVTEQVLSKSHTAVALPAASPVAQPQAHNIVEQDDDDNCDSQEPARGMDTEVKVMESCIKPAAPVKDDFEMLLRRAKAALDGTNLTASNSTSAAAAAAQNAIAVTGKRKVTFSSELSSTTTFAPEPTAVAAPVSKAARTTLNSDAASSAATNSSNEVMGTRAMRTPVKQQQTPRKALRVKQAAESDGLAKVIILQSLWRYWLKLLISVRAVYLDIIMAQPQRRKREDASSTLSSSFGMADIMESDENAAESTLMADIEAQLADAHGTLAELDPREDSIYPDQ